MKFDPVLCKCGIEAKYGLNPFELGVGYFCRHMVDYDEETRKCGWESYDDKVEDMLRFTKSMSFDSPMRAEQRRLKAANKKRTQDEREWEAARAEKQMLGNLADRLKGKIG